MHAILDVIGGLIAFLFVTNIRVVWELLRRMTELIANSWREWRFRSVRIINHGFYAAAGSFIGLSIVGTLIGPDHLSGILIIATTTVVTSALWAQLVEGSPSLLRPYGWYGGVLGVIIGSIIAKLIGTNPWLLLAAFSVGGPWIQSAGRLRCLIQGCCHGREAPPMFGIKYTHPRSRVCKLASLSGVPIHPAPLYSILWNVVLAIIMARLWVVHAPLSLIAGSYLILTGLGRFVEESYRGEPQTPIKAGLRIYQWMATLSIGAGILMTMIGDISGAPMVKFNWESIVAAGIFGIVTFFALGVDFPNSNRRFARLA